MAELKIQMTLDLRPFSKGLASALKMGKAFSDQFVKLASGLQVDVDESAFQNEISKLDTIYAGFRKEAQKDVELGADGKKVQSEAQKAESAIKKVPAKKTTIFTGNAKQLTDTIASAGLAIGAVTMGVKKVIGVFESWTTASNRQEQAERKIAQAITSTGNAAGFSASQLAKTAAELQKITTFGDEFILNNATAQLLTFTNIAGQNFLRVQKAALDVATVLSTGPEDAMNRLQGISIQLGKALNDPVANLSALSRSGIQFSAEQKEVIKHLAQTNRLAEAQALILDELEKQYGGQAEAAAKGGGALVQYSNIVGDLKEKLGDMIKIALIPIVSVLSKIVNFLNSNQYVFQALVISLSAITAGLIAAKLATIQWNLTLLANPIMAIVTGVVALSAAIGVGIQKIGGWRQAWDYAGATIRIAWEYIKAFGQGLVNFGKMATNIVTLPWKVMWETVKSVFTNIGQAWKLLLSGDIAGAFEIAKNGMISGVKNAIDDIIRSASQLSDPFENLGKKSAEIWQSAKHNTDEVADSVRNLQTLTSDVTIGFKTGMEEMKVAAVDLSDGIQTQFTITFDMVLVHLGNVISQWAEKTQNAAQSINQTINNIGKAYNALYAHKKQLIQNDMNKDIRAAQARYNAEKKRIEKTIKDEDEKAAALAQLEQKTQAEISNIKEEARQKEIKAAKKLKPIKVAQAISGTALAVINALQTKPFIPLGVASAIAAGVAGAAQIATIVAQPYVSGGKVRGGRQIIQVNEQGEEFVIHAPATRILGAELLTKIMAFPSHAKQALETIAFPAMNIPRPQYAFAYGGSTAAVETSYSNDSYSYINNDLNVDLDDIKERLNDIKNAFLGLELHAELDEEGLAVKVENGQKILEMRKVG